MRLEIKNLYCPSWNDIQALHYRNRNESMKDIKKIVWAEFMRIPAEIFFLDPVSGKSTRETRKLSPPVGIVIEAHFKGGQRRDPDNLYVKPIIDGMVAAKVIPDDNGEVVKSVTLMAKRNQEMDLVIIEVIEI